MKKKVLSLAAIIIVASIGIGIWYFFFSSPLTSQIKLNEKASTYLVTSEGTYTFDTTNGNFNLLEKNKYQIAEYVNSYYPNAKFDNRYLLMSKGWVGPQSFPTGIVTIDFKTGKVTTTDTDNYADGGSAVTKKYFYTWTTFTDSAVLTQFDKQGNEIQSKTYKGLFMLSPGFSDPDGILQLTVTRDAGNETYIDNYVTIDESNLSIISEEPLHTSDGEQYRFVESVTLEGILYTANVDIRDNTTKESTPTGQLFVKNTKTGENEFLPLPEQFPMRMTYCNDLIFIEHSYDMLGYSCFTIFNPKNKEMKLINLTDLGLTNGSASPSIDFFTFDKTGHLLFTVQNKLVSFDIESQTIVDTYSFAKENPDEYPYYIWTVS